MIKAVIFDVDGVLLDSFESNLKFFQDLLRHAGYPPPTREQFAPLFHKTMRDVIAILTRARDEEVERIWEMGRSGEVVRPHELLQIPEGAEEIIKALSKNYKLGIVTSRIREGVFSVPYLHNLKDFFSEMVAYQDTPNHKPHPEPLLLICQRLHIQPSEAVYVGDAETDIAAGKAAGMKIIQYSSRKFYGADAYTQTFRKLPELIKGLQKN